MHFLGSAGDGKSLTTTRINQINLVNPFVFLARIIIGVIRFFSVGFSIGEKRDPASVGRPLRISIVTRLCQLNKRSIVTGASVQPQILAENLPVPIGALGADYD